MRPAAPSASSFPPPHLHFFPLHTKQAGIEKGLHEAQSNCVDGTNLATFSGYCGAGTLDVSRPLTSLLVGHAVDEVRFCLIGCHCSAASCVALQAGFVQSGPSVVKGLVQHNRSIPFLYHHSHRTHAHVSPPAPQNHQLSRQTPMAHHPPNKQVDDLLCLGDSCSPKHMNHGIMAIIGVSAALAVALLALFTYQHWNAKHRKQPAAHALNGDEV